MTKYRVRSLRSRRVARRGTIVSIVALLVIASVTGLTVATAQQGPSKRFCRHHRKNAECIARRKARHNRPTTTVDRPDPTTPRPTTPRPTTPQPTTPQPTTPQPTDPPPPPPPPGNQCATSIAGITIDDVSGLSGITSGLAAMPKRPTTRVVFDENVDASYYAGPVSSVHQVSGVMGELLDSAYVKRVSVAEYTARMRSYLATLGNNVDIWEIGNEVNGNWLGAYSDVSAKITGAFSVANAANKKTALTLYYNPNGVDGPNEPTPQEFSQQYVPANVRAGLDYVLLSYYEPDFNDYRPSPAVITQQFEQLHALYPNAVLGFGEIGLRNPATSSTMSDARSMMAYYYGLSINLPYYCGGYFWWYGAQDVLGSGAPLTAEFKAALNSMP